MINKDMRIMRKVNHNMQIPMLMYSIFKKILSYTPYEDTQHGKPA